VHIWTDHKNLISHFHPELVPSFKRQTVEGLLRWTLDLNSLPYRFHHIEGQLNVLPHYVNRYFGVLSAEPFVSIKKLRFTDRKKSKYNESLIEARRRFRQSVPAYLNPG